MLKRIGRITLGSPGISFVILWGSEESIRLNSTVLYSIRSVRVQKNTRILNRPVCDRARPTRRKLEHNEPSIRTCSDVNRPAPPSRPRPRSRPVASAISGAARNACTRCVLTTPLMKNSREDGSMNIGMTSMLKSDRAEKVTSGVSRSPVRKE